MKGITCLFGLLLVLITSVCSIFVGIVYQSNGKEHFCCAFWGSIILIIAIFICFTICFFKDKESKLDELKTKIDKLDRIFESLQKYGEFDIIEEFGNSSCPKKVTKKNQMLISLMKEISNVLMEIN